MLLHLRHAESGSSEQDATGSEVETEKGKIAVTTKWRYNLSGANEEVLRT
jgi:hypothetical protein